MNLSKKYVLLSSIILISNILPIDTCRDIGVCWAEEVKDGPAYKEVVINWVNEIKGIANGNSSDKKSEYEKSIRNISDQARISKNFCGFSNTEVFNSVVSYYVIMLMTDTVVKILKQDSDFIISKVINSGTLFNVYGSLKSKNSSDKPISLIIHLNKDRKLCDLTIEQVSLSKSLMSQIKADVKNESGKTLTQFSKEERAGVVVQSIKKLLNKQDS